MKTLLVSEVKVCIIHPGRQYCGVEVSLARPCAPVEECGEEGVRGRRVLREEGVGEMRIEE